MPKENKNCESNGSQPSQDHARARKGGTPADLSWHPKFLETLSKTGLVNYSAEVCGVERRTTYAHREMFADFAAQWEQALEHAADVVEAAARNRAVMGWEEPVYQGGVKVGSVRKFSDQLAMFILKGRRRAVFGEHVEHTGDGGGPLTVIFKPAPSREEVEKQQREKEQEGPATE